MNFDIPIIKGVQYLLCNMLCAAIYIVVADYIHTLMASGCWLVAMLLSLKWLKLESYLCEE